MSGPVARARGLLTRPGGWIDAAGGAYAVRLGPDRRSRVLLTLDEAMFRALVETPGLRARPGGGWTARPVQQTDEPAEFGAPGRIEGTRSVMLADGQMVALRANLGESPIAWLARRRDASGRSWLTTAQIAAGERLRRDAEIAQTGPSMTMRWDALPRSGGGSSARAEPGDRAMNAGRRVQAALTACAPCDRAMVEQVCIRDTALQVAEREAGLKRREGKLALRAGLTALAAHYGIG